VNIAKNIPLRLNKRNPFYQEEEEQLEFDVNIEKFPSKRTKSWQVATLGEIASVREYCSIPILPETRKDDIYDFTMSSYK
jgi:hypothetical protein